jgi:hypothetical protein
MKNDKHKFLHFCTIWAWMAFGQCFKRLVHRLFAIYS